MRSRDVWVLAAVLVLAGVALLWLADERASTLPGDLPALWAIGAFVALPVLFWIHYAVELDKLRG